MVPLHFFCIAADNVSSNDRPTLYQEFAGDGNRVAAGERERRSLPRDLAGLYCLTIAS